MNLNVYAIYNRLISAYNPPIFTNEDSESIKSSLSRYCVLNSKEALAQHFNECELYKIGEFNDETGDFVIVGKPSFLCSFGNLFKELDHGRD